MDNCPKCNSSWIGDLIPENINQPYEYKGEFYYPYGKNTHWKREIGIDGGMMGIYDGIVAYKCPDCNEYVPRNSSSWAKEMFDKFINYKE